MEYEHYLQNEKFSDNFWRNRISLIPLNSLIRNYIWWWSLHQYSANNRDYWKSQNLRVLPIKVFEIYQTLRRMISCYKATKVSKISRGLLKLKKLIITLMCNVLSSHKKHNWWCLKGFHKRPTYKCSLQ